ncbi:MAG TPA: OmpA family protein [Parafilimonas sp.]|nr:OmpA family protein [Parafilimonas sp.]
MRLQKILLIIACILIMHSMYAQDQSSGVSVHFEFDKSDISTSDLEALQSFKAAHPDIESIIIDGYADTTGRDAYNYALSMRRCIATKKALGYNEAKTEVILKVTAHGEKDLLFATDPENRVTIVTINNKKPVAIKEEEKPQEPVAVDTVVTPPPPPVAAVPAPAPPVVEKDTVATPVSSVPKEFGDDASDLVKTFQNSKPGESVVLKEILFQPASHQLLKSSKSSLNAVLDALKKIPTLNLEIQGHMCCGDPLAIDGFDQDSKDFALSNNRAKAVYDFLVSNGIDASRLAYKGFGTRERLVSPEVTDDDRSRNRRVEFVITKI